jgi:heme peroxidase
MTMRSPGSVLPVFFKPSNRGTALYELALHQEPTEDSPENTASVPPADPRLPSRILSASQEDTEKADQRPQPKVRNLFGKPTHPDEVYCGYGKSLQEQQATHAMLEQLAIHMMKCPWPFAKELGRDNPHMPSGYTYLAQLAAHDLISNIAPLPRLGDPVSCLARDFRLGRLVLDTIYGGGPLATPLPYAVAGDPANQRYNLRLGYGPPNENVEDPKQPGVRLRQPPNTNAPARDIGRVACPYLTDAPGDGPPDPLIADPRNDDHVIISQLTALFHEFHNIVCAKLAAKDGGKTDDFSTYRRFLEARKAVTIAYRRIVVEDLLQRLLEPNVYAYYADPKTRYPADFLDQVDDERVPVEFSHAAYRFGHVMIRFSYTLNGKRDNGKIPLPGKPGKYQNIPDTASIKEILDRSSARRADKLPLACTWLVDWSRFFDLGGEPAYDPGGKPYLNLSRRIAPDVGGGTLGSNNELFGNEEHRVGGLFLRDLIRGTHASMRTVNSLVEKLRAPEVARSPLLNDASFREKEIRRWLSESAEHSFSDSDLSEISRNPPLFFFVLFEAAHSHNGQHLGTLGSTILAEVFFAAHKKTRTELEDDASLQPALQSAFDGNLPASMPALVRFIRSEGGLKDIDCGTA